MPSSPPTKTTPFARGLSSLIWLASEKLLQLAFSALSVGLIARALGPTQFGEFQYVLSVLFIFSAIGLMAGSETAAPRLTSCTDKAQRQKLLGSLLLLRLLVGSLACISMTIWAFVAEADRSSLLLILALSLLITEPFNVLRLIRETQQRTRVIAMVRLAVSFVKILCIYWLYQAHAGVMAFVWVYSLEYFVVAAAYFYLIRDDGFFWHWKTDASWMRFFLSKGATIWVGIVSLILMQRLDRVILESRIPSDLYGHYTAAMSLLDSAWFFGPVAIAALAPSMVYSAHKAHNTQSALRFTLILALLGGVGALMLFLLSPVIIPLIFGQGFLGSVPIIQAGAFIFIPGFCALALDAILIKRHQHSAVTVKWVCALIATNVVLLPYFAHLSWAQGPMAIGAGYLTSLVVGLLLLQRKANTPNSHTSPSVSE